MYELLFTKSFISKEEWLKITHEIGNYIGSYKVFNLIVELSNKKVNFYLKTKVKMPIKIKEHLPFLLKKVDIRIKSKYSLIPHISSFSDNILNIYDKSNNTLKYITISFVKINNKLVYKIIGNFSDIYKRLYFRSFDTLISIDFSNYSTFFYTKVPKYLNMNKTLHLLSSNNTNSTMTINTFPYFDNNYYLNQINYDYNKHSLILGSSGAGKSKFISLFVSNTLKLNNTKIVIIDPHGALEDDIGGLGKVIDFNTNSVNLFGYDDANIISNQEKIVTSLKSIFKDNYNAKIERLLKYTVTLLLLNNAFNLMNLKKVLIDTEYRNSMLNKTCDNEFIISFFTNDFNELKTRSYSEAFVPIISLIDELSFLPSFNKESKITIEEEIKNNDLLLFSLKPSNLGNNNIKLISALIMNKIMSIKESWSINDNIIFIVDEISVVENEILSRILSEGRKYGLALILAGQFLDQLSPTIQNSIFANVLNYYLFRISKSDAITMSNNIDIDLISKDTDDKLNEAKQKLLTNLNNREVIIKLHKNGINYPCMKGTTQDFISIPRIDKKITLTKEESTPKEKKKFEFNIENIEADDVMKSLSTKRKGNI